MSHYRKILAGYIVFTLVYAYFGDPRFVFLTAQGAGLFIFDGLK